MFVINGTSVIQHADADCHCTSFEQWRKHDMKGLQPCVLSSQNSFFEAKANGVTATDSSRDNVISITALIKSARQLSAGQVNSGQVSKVKFNYPMLECS